MFRVVCRKTAPYSPEPRTGHRPDRTETAAWVILCKIATKTSLCIPPQSWTGNVLYLKSPTNPRWCARMAEQVLRKLNFSRTLFVAAGWMAIAMPVAISSVVHARWHLRWDRSLS
jgi:hypothetical protein